MDMTKLTQKHNELVEHLEEVGYSTGYLHIIERTIAYLLENSDSEGWGSYKDAYESYCRVTPSRYMRENTCMALGVIREFVLHDRYPDGTRSRSLFRHSAADDLAPGFREIVDRYSSAELARGKKDRTVRSEAGEGAVFLKAMQNRGRVSLDEITEEDVLSFFLGDGGPCRSAGYAATVRRVLATAAPDCDARTRILSFVPNIRDGRKNVQYLTDDEVRAVKSLVDDPHSELSLRDRAVVLLLVHYGLRRSDIAALRLESIDWAESAVRIVQRKTREPLELPLLPVVGNAIFDYVARERGTSDLPWVFLPRTTVKHECGPGFVTAAANRALTLAGLRQEPGDRRGTHIFRHHFATALMSAGVARPIISKAMGHANPKSTNAYLSADLAHLRECALSVERFPVPEEVFDRAV